MPLRKTRSRTNSPDTDAAALWMRKRFLGELIQMKPTILSALRRILTTFAAVQHHLIKRVAGGSVQGRYGWFKAAFPESGAADQLRAELEGWANTNGINVPWILDAALNTLDLWHRARPEHKELRRSLWLPPAVGQDVAEQAPRFLYEAPGTFMPPMKLHDYETRLRADVERALRAHLAEIARGHVLPRLIERDLRWLAAKVAGQSQVQISLSDKRQHVSTVGRGDKRPDVSTVGRGIVRAARLIGFPLRLERPRKRRTPRQLTD